MNEPTTTTTTSPVSPGDLAIALRDRHRSGLVEALKTYRAAAAAGDVTAMAKSADQLGLTDDEIVSDATALATVSELDASIAGFATDLANLRDAADMDREDAALAEQMAIATRPMAEKRAAIATERAKIAKLKEETNGLEEALRSARRGSPRLFEPDITLAAARSTPLGAAYFERS